MSDDLVTRLRTTKHDTEDRHCPSCDGFCCTCELCDCCIEVLNSATEAANEIERLRADRDNWAELATMYAASHRKLHGLEKAWDNE